MQEIDPAHKIFCNYTTDYWSTIGSTITQDRASHRCIHNSHNMPASANYKPSRISVPGSALGDYGERRIRGK